MFLTMLLGWFSETLVGKKHQQCEVGEIQVSSRVTCFIFLLCSSKFTDDPGVAKML